jgi:hypothetical protein
MTLPIAFLGFGQVLVVRLDSGLYHRRAFRNSALSVRTPRISIGEQGFREFSMPQFGVEWRSWYTVTSRCNVVFVESPSYSGDAGIRT